MTTGKDATLVKVNLMIQARLILLLGLAFLIPFYFSIQWVSGPLVNAILIIILFLSKRSTAFAASFIPSLAAIAGGLMPITMLPMVPIIIAGNIIFIFIIDLVYNRYKNSIKGYWYGVGLGSMAKFIFLSLTVDFFAPIFLKNIFLTKIINLFSWPQLATALSGGVIAWAFLKWLKRF